MGNSISTTPNTQTATNSTAAAFKAGDAVLWAAVSDDAYKLQASSDKHSTRLVINHANIEYSFDACGRSNPDDALPSLFHDTPTNRQAIATLYHGASATQSNTRKVIDITEPDDNEVILLSSHNLSDIACDIESAATVISDIGKLLALIHYEKIDTGTAISMARLTHDTTVTWDDLLQRQVSSIKETLALTGYGKGAINHG